AEMRLVHRAEVWLSRIGPNSVQAACIDRAQREDQQDQAGFEPFRANVRRETSPRQNSSKPASPHLYLATEFSSLVGVMSCSSSWVFWHSATDGASARGTPLAIVILDSGGSAMRSTFDSGALSTIYRTSSTAQPGLDRRAQPARDLLVCRVRGEFS